MSTPLNNTIGVEYSKLVGAVSVILMEIVVDVLPPEFVPVIV
jgi:hypothetical protein